MKKSILSCLILTVLLTGCGSINQNTSTVTVTKLNSNSNTSSKGNINFIMAGKVSTAEKADVVSKISGRISELKVDVGTVVKKGDPIVVLDTRDLEAQVSQAEAQVGIAEANLAKLQSGSRPEQIAQAQASVDSTKAAYDSAKAGYDNAKANYDNANTNYNRTNNLFQVGTATQQQLDTADVQLKSADAAVKTAQAAIKSVEASNKSAVEALDMLNKGETKESIDVSQAQLAQAQAALEVSKTALINGTITAPVSGVISAKNVNAGEIASPGVPLVTIVNSDSLIINAYLPPEYLDEIKVDQEVAIKVSEVSDKSYNGKVYVINPQTNSKNTNIQVKILVENADSSLKSGMFAEVGIK